MNRPRNPTNNPEASQGITATGPQMPVSEVLCDSGDVANTSATISTVATSATSALQTTSTQGKVLGQSHVRRICEIKRGFFVAPDLKIGPRH